MYFPEKKNKQTHFKSLFTLDRESTKHDPKIMKNHLYFCSKQEIIKDLPMGLDKIILLSL